MYIYRVPRACYSVCAHVVLVLVAVAVVYIMIYVEAVAYIVVLYIYIYIVRKFYVSNMAIYKYPRFINTMNRDTIY